MFDSNALSATYLTMPNERIIFDNGGFSRLSSSDKKPYKYIINGEKDSKEPRITITRGEYEWIVKAEVSIGEWMFGSNIYLPEEKDLSDYLELLSQFVYFKTGYQFYAETSRVTRLDVTSDYFVGESRVKEILKAYGNITIPKYNRKPVNDSTVAYEVKGNKKNKKYNLYDKRQKFLDEGADSELLNLSKGILRLEVQHKDNKAVSNLAKSLKKSYHSADLLLNKAVSDAVIEKAVNVLSLDQFLQEKTDSTLEILAREFTGSSALLRAGHLAYKAKYGENYAQTLSIGLTPATIKKYERECKKIGCSSLE